MTGEAFQAELAGDGYLTVRHGTNSLFAANIRRGIHPVPGTHRLDFGPGFYTTTAPEVAEAMAHLRTSDFGAVAGLGDALWPELGCADRAAYLRTARTPAVMRFRLPWGALRGVPHRIFLSGEEDGWRHFVRACWSGRTHGFAWVFGPMAVDVAGRPQVVPTADQLSFHTEGLWRMLLEGEETG